MSYHGQKRTCGRCHRYSPECPGRGIGRNCELNGGEKVDLRVHMENVWREIGFKPKPSDVEEEDDE